LARLPPRPVENPFCCQVRRGAARAGIETPCSWSGPTGFANSPAGPGAAPCRAARRANQRVAQFTFRAGGLVRLKAERLKPVSEASRR
jgi:hypothetical protein